MGPQRAGRRDAKCAGLALAKIGDLKLSPTPSAYFVFFAYYEGKSPDLTRHLEYFLKNNIPIDDIKTQELYEAYCLRREDTNAVSSLTKSVADELGKLLALMGDAGRNTTEYQSTLESASNRLDAGLSADEVRDIIGRVVLETQSVIAYSQALEQKLIDSASTIDSLSTELEGIRRKAIIDPLTQLVNRGEFERAVGAAIAATDGEMGAFSLLIADIDHFKQVNDTYGHPVGDKVIRLTASTIRNNIQSKDVAARYGGEEFVIYLEGTGLGQATHVAEALRVAVADQTIVRKTSGERHGSVTISIGVAEYTPGDTIETLVERADRALYLAKHRGRNRVMTERDLAAPPAAA